MKFSELNPNTMPGYGDPETWGGRHPYHEWEPTHVSRVDGSPARLIKASPNGLNLLLENEDGYQWQGSVNEWESIDDRD